MLGRDFALTTAQIGVPRISTEKLPSQHEALIKAMGDFGKAYNRNNYSEALASGDQDAITKALASYDPDALRQQQVREQELSNQYAQQEKMLGLQQDFNAKQQERAFNNQWALAKWKHQNDLDKLNLAKEEREKQLQEAENFINSRTDLDDTQKQDAIAEIRYRLKNPSGIGKIGSDDYTKEFNKESAKDYAKKSQAMDESANDSMNNLNLIEEAINAVNNDSAYMGFGGDAVNNLKMIASSLGADIQGLDDAAIINTVSSQLMGSLRKDLMPGPLSDRDLQFLVRMTPNLGKTKEQNLAILNMYQKMHQRNIDIANFKNDYISQYGVWDNEGQKQLRKMFDKTLFTQEEKDLAEGKVNKKDATNPYANVSNDDLLGEL